MNDDLKPNMTEEGLTEWKALINKLTDVERHILLRLLELHPLEDILEILDVMSEDDGIIEYHYTTPDPYAMRKIVPSEGYNHNFWIGEDGHTYVKNPSALWLPELTLEREIGGTIYTITGAYEGTETLDKKLKRIIMQNLEMMEENK